MVSEARKQPLAWMETDYSKHKHFRWKIKWRLEHLGALGVMGEEKYIIRYIFISLYYRVVARDNIVAKRG